MPTPIKILVACSIIFSLLLMGSYLLPSEFSVERNTVIVASPQKIYSYLNDLKTWEQWSVWSLAQDSSMQFVYPDKKVGERAIQKWQGAKMGSGRIKLIECLPAKEIVFQLDMENSNLKMEGVLLFINQEINTQQDTLTNLSWEIKGKIVGNPIFRYVALRFDEAIGKDLAAALERLKQLVELAS